MAYSASDPVVCGCTDAGYGTAPQQQMMIDPAPAP
jgi:hypothetical protein